MIEKTDAKKGQIKVEHMVDLIILLETNYYQYLINDYGITLYLY